MASLNKVSNLLVQATGKTLVASVRNNGNHAFPPRVRVSFAEKVAHGVVMTLGVSAIPVWVLTHMEDYRNGNRSV